MPKAKDMEKKRQKKQKKKGQKSLGFAYKPRRAEGGLRRKVKRMSHTLMTHWTVRVIQRRIEARL